MTQYKPVLSIAQQLAPRNAPLRVIKSSSLYVSQPNPSWFGNPPDKPDGAWSCKHWLTSRFHFSFAEYAGGPGNFGVLRVIRVRNSSRIVRDAIDASNEYRNSLVDGHAGAS